MNSKRQPEQNGTGTKFLPERAGCALAEAIYRGDAAVARGYEVVPLTLRRWRQRLRFGTTPDDDILRAIFNEKR